MNFLVNIRIRRKDWDGSPTVFKEYSNIRLLVINDDDVDPVEIVKNTYDLDRFEIAKATIVPMKQICFQLGGDLILVHKTSPVKTAKVEA